MHKGILLLELNGSPPLPDPGAMLAILGMAPSYKALSPGQALTQIQSRQNDFAILISNAPSKKVLAAFRRYEPKGETILITDMTMDQYSPALDQDEDKLLDHVISSQHGLEWTINTLRVTIRKIMGNDIFGIEKYLQSETMVMRKKVTQSDQRRELNKGIMDYAASLKLTNATCKLLYGISEELLMNAIYDAPTGKDGRSIYGDIKRTKMVSLPEDNCCYLSYGCDGKTFALGVRDPFGSLERDKFFSYIRKVVRRHEGNKIIDTKKGGAGLGLFKILYSSHALISNSHPGHITEVISLTNIHSQIRDFSRMTRSLHFFIQNNGS